MVAIPLVTSLYSLLKMKNERLDFVAEWEPKLEGIEHIIVHTDETGAGWRISRTNLGNSPSRGGLSQGLCGRAIPWVQSLCFGLRIPLK